METIYIQLMNEGTEVWRPVLALKVSDDLFEIPADTPTPDDEEWQFSPGSRVKCKVKDFSGGENRLVAIEIA